MRRVVGIMGGGQVSPEDEACAEMLGRLVAEAGWILVNGGRNAGIMAASARGARAAGGVVIGILPGVDRRGASPDLDVSVVTGLGDARNLVNVLTSEVVLVCPGQAGTLSEAALALKNRRPVVTVGFDIGAAFDAYRQEGLLHDVRTPEAAIEVVRGLLEG